MATEHTRATDPATSRHSAAYIAKNAVVGRWTQKLDLLGALVAAGDTGLTADEAAIESRHYKSWRRFYDLATVGYSRGTGEVRPAVLGGRRPQQVHVVTDAGRAVWAWFEANPDERYYRP